MLQRQQGHALLATMITVMVVTTAIGGSMMMTANMARLTDRTRQREAAVAIGDAHIEWAFAQWRAVCQTKRNEAPTTADLASFTAPSLSLLPNANPVTVNGYSLTAIDKNGKAIASAPVTKGQNGDEASYFYLASVNVSKPTINDDVVVKMRRIFEKRLESPWKYAIAYLAADRPALEIHPSPTFTVNGWVHTNGQLYACPDGGNPLKFLDAVTSVDGYTQGYMPGAAGFRNKPLQGAPPTFAPGIPATLETRKDAFGISPSQFDSGDSNPNNDSYRELIEQPNKSFNDPLTYIDSQNQQSNPRFFNSAGVRILIDANNDVSILNRKGNAVSANSSDPQDRQLYNKVRPAIVTGQTIRDNREAANVRLTSVDVNKIVPSQIPDWNGVIYISDTSASQTGGSPKRGIRLRNGSTLPSGGITFVSDNPVYIQGDYNTVGGRKPSSVLTDAINILSNAWNDANSSAGIDSRTASTTTVNTALLSGIVKSSSAFSGQLAYSGGVENYPRFHENWSGKTFNYTGSMVQLFDSKQGTGRWGKDNVYNPPNRNWAFDTNFRTSPPPGTLFTTTYVKHRWYLE